jgi:hypothetical protein
MLETLKRYFPAVHRHPAKHLHEFSQPFDPMTSELHPSEHGIVRRLSAEMVQANGLILDYADRGAATWRVN